METERQLNPITSVPDGYLEALILDYLKSQKRTSYAA